VNSAPSDLDYPLLAKAGMHLNHISKEEPVTVTTGFPFSTYQFYKNQAMNLLSEDNVIDYDSSTIMAVTDLLLLV
jgi:plasmid segregation protein ParM